MTTDNIVIWATRLSIVDCFFQDSDFAGDLEDSKSISRAILCIFGSRTFVTICRMCKKHTSASHSSTESEIISLDAGLRMDELLGLWDMVREVLSSTNSTKTPTNPASDRCEIRNPFAKHTQLQTKGKTRCQAVVACGLRSH